MFVFITLRFSVSLMWNFYCDCCWNRFTAVYMSIYICSVGVIPFKVLLTRINVDVDLLSPGLCSSKGLSYSPLAYLVVTSSFMRSFLCLCLSVCLPRLSVSRSPSVYLAILVCLSRFYLPVPWAACLPLCLSVRPFFRLSVCLSVLLSVFRLSLLLPFQFQSCLCSILYPLFVIPLFCRPIHLLIALYTNRLVHQTTYHFFPNSQI